MGEGGTESTKNQEKGKKVAIGGGDGGPYYESGPKKPLQVEIASDGDARESRNRPDKRWSLTDTNTGAGTESSKNQDEGKKVEIVGGVGEPLNASGPKKPLQAEISSVGDDQATGNPLEKRWNLTDKNTGGGTESSKNQDEGKKVEIGEGDDGPSNESGTKKLLQAEISSDGDDQETGNPLEKRWNLTDNMGGGSECSKNQGKEKKVEIGGGDGSHEFGPKKPLQAEISLDDDDQETGNPPEKRWNLTDKNTEKNQDEGKKVETGGGDGGPSQEFGPKKPLQAKISLDGDDQENGNPPEKRLNLTDRSTGGGSESNKKQDDGKVEISGGDGGPRFRPKKPLLAEISSDGDNQKIAYQIRGPVGGLYLGDRGRQWPPWVAGSSSGWVGLYTHHYGTNNPPGPNYSFGKDFCGPAWVGLQGTGFSKKNGPPFGSHEFTFKDQFVNNFVEVCPKTQIGTGSEGFGQKVVNPDVTGWARKNSQNDTEKGVKTGQDGIFKDSLKSNHLVVTTGQDKTDAGGEEEQTFSFASWGKKNDEKTAVLPQDSSKPDQCAKKESETNCKSGSFESDKGLDLSTLVEAKTDSRHGWGALWGTKGNTKPQTLVTEGSNGGRPKTRKRRRKANKADVTGFIGKKSENDTEQGVKRTSQDDIFRDSSKSNQLGTKNSWVGSLGQKVVKTGQDDIFKNSFNSDQWGTKKSLTGSWNKWSREADKTNVLLQDSSKPDQRAKKYSDLWGKTIQNETNCELVSFESYKGLDWSKLVEAKTDLQHGWGLKRKHPDTPVGGPSDGLISGGPFTASKRHLDMSSTNEQEIELIMRSIQRIMHQKGYNDGDPLSADDQTYILENVFNHHPEKAQKMGAGVDYIMVAKHTKFQGTRCFYVVSTDGRKEDFSYHKCLKNFVSGKYRDKVDE